MITEEFDPERRAIINPQETLSPIEGFPKIAIGAFSDVIVKRAVEEYGAKQIALLKSASGNIPIYSFSKDGTEYALYTAYVGAPMAAGQIEGLGVFGAKSFVCFGSCGVLDKSIDHGQLIVPVSALRGEGVSHYYLPPSEFVEIPGSKLAASTLTQLGYPFVQGPVWTTDAVYRETRGLVEKHRAQGCIAVEMECASMAAVCEFRGYRFAQFLFAADNLDSPEWEKRNLSEKGIAGYQIYINAAMAIGRALEANS